MFAQYCIEIMVPVYFDCFPTAYGQRRNLKLFARRSETMKRRLSRKTWHQRAIGDVNLEST